MYMRNAQSDPPRLPLLSQTAEHALRAVLYLARHRAKGLVAASEIARALGAPKNYLSKTLRRLVQRGLLRSARGPKGGFELLVHPASLPASRVLEAVGESVQSSPTCLLGDHPCDPSDPCEVHVRWITLVEQVLRPMEETSVADLLGGEFEAAPNEKPEAEQPLEVISP